LSVFLLPTQIDAGFMRKKDGKFLRLTVQTTLGVQGCESVISQVSSPGISRNPLACLFAVQESDSNGGADGVYFNVRLDEERTCVLVLIGATEDGTKELLAVVDGYRESTHSWREVLGQLKRLGLSAAPKLAIGDGSLGFWIALEEEYGSIAQQRCWVHKTANILDKMPKSVQGKAKQLIHEMYLAPTRKAALAAFDQFLSSYQIKFPKACECLEKDKEVLFIFYDFPAQHWTHLRTTNPIESTFATVRLRTHRTKGCGSRIATLTMVFKLGLEAQKHWRRLQGFELIPKVITGVQFVDGEEQTQQAA
jgi:transposase-like protein